MHTPEAENPAAAISKKLQHGDTNHAAPQRVLKGSDVSRRLTGRKPEDAGVRYPGAMAVATEAKEECGLLTLDGSLLLPYSFTAHNLLDGTVHTQGECVCFSHHLTLQLLSLEKPSQYH